MLVRETDQRGERGQEVVTSVRRGASGTGRASQWDVKVLEEQRCWLSRGRGTVGADP